MYKVEIEFPFRQKDGGVYDTLDAALDEYHRLIGWGMTDAFFITGVHPSIVWLVDNTDVVPKVLEHFEFYDYLA